jgi:DNA-directed RNA polymerase I subunit RPA1
MQECPGHLGHIELAVPVYNPTLFPLLYRLLRLKCYACHRFRAPAQESRILKVRLMLLDLGRLNEAMDLEARMLARPAASDELARGDFGAASGRRGGGAKKKKGKASEADAEEMEEENDDGASGVQSEALRQSRFLADVELDCIAHGGPDVGCGLGADPGAQYSQQVRAYRATIIADYLRSFPAKTCANCRALALPVRKDGYSKIFQRPLSRKAAAGMGALGVRYRSATAIINERAKSAARAAVARKRAGGDDPDDLVDEDEEEEEEDEEDGAGIEVDEAEVDASSSDEDDDNAGMDGSSSHKEQRQRRRRRRPEEPHGARRGPSDSEPAAASDELLGYGGGADDNSPDEDDDEGAAGGGGGRGGGEPKPRFLPASEVAAQMELLWEAEAELLRRVYLPVKRDGSLTRKRSNLTSSSGAAAAAAAAALEAGKGAGLGGVGAGSTSLADGWRHLFLRVLPVPPPRFRPPTRLGEAQFEHPQNVYLNKIIRLNDQLVDLGLGPSPSAASASSSSAAAAASAAKVAATRGGVDMKQALGAWMELQNMVNGLMDSTKMQTGGAGDAANGIRQLLEKKEGMFRKNMMGKRVNFAARTVISPDPFLRVDQVGVPLRFAKRLSFKQAVTPWNVHALRKAVVNGPDIWPGATHVEDETGNVVDLSIKTAAQREAIAKLLLKLAPDAVTPIDPSGGGPAAAHFLEIDRPAAAAGAAAGGLQGVGVKRVWRHLQDGDIVLMNRQVSVCVCFATVPPPCTLQ